MTDNSTKLLDDEVPTLMPRPEAPTVTTPNVLAPKGAMPIAGLALDAIATMRRRAEGVEQAIPTPWREVNDALQGGLWPAMYTLTSGTGSGKSQWALQVALHAAQCEQRKPKDEQRPVVYVALELGALDLVARLAGLLSGKRWSDLFYGNGGDALDNLDEAQAALNRANLDDLPLMVEVAPPMGWSADRLLALAEELKPRMIVLDYLQLISASKDDARADLRQVIGKVAYVARAIAREYGTTMLLLSSTARHNYGAAKGEEEQPGNGDPSRFVGIGKESGEIEFAADVALVLVREKWKEDQTAKTWLAVAKQRGGRNGWVALNFDGAKFTEADVPPATKSSQPQTARDGANANGLGSFIG